MKFSSLATIAAVCGAAAVTAQTLEPCTYTATPCAPFGGSVETITVYEQPFTATATATYDCQGCGAVTVEPRDCEGVGPVVISTTFEFLNAQSTTTVPVCSPTPN